MPVLFLFLALLNIGMLVLEIMNPSPAWHDFLVIMLVIGTICSIGVGLVWRGDR